jgi:hypothetical protein
MGQRPTIHLSSTLISEVTSKESRISRSVIWVMRTNKRVAPTTCPR